MTYQIRNDRGILVTYDKDENGDQYPLTCDHVEGAPCPCVFGACPRVPK